MRAVAARRGSSSAPWPMGATVPCAGGSSERVLRQIAITAG
ncbi:hypothetical protein SCE1572_39640 [Sorangium cellulosum So0157-2]|uniref:Uncharacterized protein n=1 Tax=Sorangium cellulosum So0157-2 TaxID=1254432 RepID=S4YBB8_SORCE|nr:hypothetical protein SCE1572_39640 [Sorangium cellulosum So0157-2]